MSPLMRLLALNHTANAFAHDQTRQLSPGLSIKH